MFNSERFVSQYYRFRRWLGPRLLLFLKVIFGVFLADAVVELSNNVFAGNNLFNELDTFLRIVQKWALVGGSCTVLWLILRGVLDVDLLLYYHIWINKIVPKVAPYLFRRKILKRRRLQDIRDSFRPQGDRGKSTPTFVRREDLERKNYWPNWSFSIVTIFEHRKVVQEVFLDDGDENKEKKKKWVLKVDLKDESYGIYNNAGKEYLRHHFGEVAKREQTLKESINFHQFMMPSTAPGNSQEWRGSGGEIPLRWASGGFLPIVRYRDKRWALLFFRDIPLIGLNVANGASENKKEYKDLRQLIGREFSEEVMLLSSPPNSGDTVRRNTFATYTFAQQANTEMSPYISEQFTSKHADLRLQHDNILLKESPDFVREIKPIHTPFSVRVEFHRPDLKSEDSSTVSNIIYSLNATEFGIEVIWLGSFALKENECIIDGEYDLSNEFLIRRPVVLLDMDFLQQIYTQNRSLGELLTRPSERFECKILPNVPPQHVVTFNADIELRHTRLNGILKQLHPDLNKTMNYKLKKERDLIRFWLSRYAEAFKEVPERGLQDEHLRTLCPVTWKTLELIFAHKIDYRV